MVNDSDLVAQFPTSAIQTGYMNAHKALLKTNPPTSWKALMCTNGHYHQCHQDLTTEHVTRVMYLRDFMLWYVFSDEAPGDKSADRIPDMGIFNGIVLDSMAAQ